MTYCDFHISEGWNVSGNDEGLELLNYVKLDPFLGCRRTDPPLSVITQDSDSVEDIGKLEREISAKMCAINTPELAYMGYQWPHLLRKSTHD